MGELFRSFDEAWAYFLARSEPMETLAPPFGAPWTLAWLVSIAPELVPRLVELQAPLARLPFLRLMPSHYLHLTVALVGPADAVPPVGECLLAAERAWRDVSAFDISLAHVNCFHEAVVVEVAPERWDLPELLAGRPLDFLLPHVTLAGTDGGDPEQLREVVVPLRDADVGLQRVTRVELCLVPTAPERFLDPWQVVGAVDLRG
jgi:2'-5' RNA ligase